jgi:large subunit ribosomal protein L24
MRPCVQGADLALSGSYYLVEGTIDGRLMLKGPEGAGGPAGTRPELTIVLKGPLEAPRRTLEVAALANWLALRAVDQQTKKIDALESGRELPGTTSAVPNTAIPAPSGTQSPAANPAQRRAATRRSQRTTPPAERAPSFFGTPLDLRPPASIGAPSGAGRF